MGSVVSGVKACWMGGGEWWVEQGLIFGAGGRKLKKGKERKGERGEGEGKEEGGKEEKKKQLKKKRFYL